ncbi:MAG TPA: hypothetical protein VKA08_08465, partial [Balneolales bacterium]|nr:hypothetical protein [Balneolales bacterium]
YTARNNVDEGLQTTRDKLMETFHKETVIPDTTRELTWSLVKTDTAKKARGEQLKDVDIYNPFDGSEGHFNVRVERGDIELS